MTTAIFERFSLPRAASLFQTARAFFASNSDETAPVDDEIDLISRDQTGFTMLPQTELKIHPLTDVERDDVDMIGRVRAALYED